MEMFVMMRPDVQNNEIQKRLIVHVDESSDDPVIRLKIETINAPAPYFSGNRMITARDETFKLSTILDLVPRINRLLDFFVKAWDENITIRKGVKQ